MAAVDTNVLVRLLLEDDHEQARHANAFLRARHSVFVPNLVLVEASWVLTSIYELGREELARTIELVLAADAFRVEKPELVTEALRLFRDSTADFADCLIVAIAAAAGERPVATFDRRAGRLPGSRRLGARARR